MESGERVPTPQNAYPNIASPRINPSSPLCQNSSSYYPQVNPAYPLPTSSVKIEEVPIPQKQVVVQMPVSYMVPTHSEVHIIAHKHVCSLVCCGIFITLLTTPIFGLLYLCCVASGPSYSYAKKGVGIGWILYSLLCGAAGALAYVYTLPQYNILPDGVLPFNWQLIQYVAYGLFGVTGLLFVVGVCMVCTSNRALKGFKIKNQVVPQNSHSPIYPVHQGVPTQTVYPSYSLSSPTNLYQQQIQQQQYGSPSSVRYPGYVPIDASQQGQQNYGQY